jgi:hypothetical protein
MVLKRILPSKTFPIAIYYNQTDIRWSEIPYAKGKFANLGSGPTCLAMVVSTIAEKKSITPDVVGRWSIENGYCIDGEGISYDSILAYTQLKSVTLMDMGEMTPFALMNLHKENIIISAQGPGLFTDSSSFIVLAGVDKDGLIIVNDPNSIERSEKTWDFEEIRKSDKMCWTFSR